MAQPKSTVTLDPTTHIEPIPTAAGGVGRGPARESMLATPTLTLNIFTPHTNDIVGKNSTISVKGNVAFQGAQDDTFKSLDRVDVRFGENGSLVEATVSGVGWQFTGAVPSGAIGGTPLQISVHAE